MSDDFAHKCVYVERDDRGARNVCWICGRTMPKQSMTDDGRNRMQFSDALTSFFAGTTKKET